MKLRSAVFPAFVFSASVFLLSSCEKKISEDNSQTLISGYSKSIPEIGLKINFDFQRTNPDAFKATVSDNFAIEQVNSLYNSDQKIEYFILRCKKSDGTTYNISATVDEKDAVTASFGQTISIN